jgi:hypothetical protein
VDSDLRKAASALVDGEFEKKQTQGSPWPDRVIYRCCDGSGGATSKDSLLSGDRSLLGCDENLPSGGTYFLGLTTKEPNFAMLVTVSTV